jgi:anti-sigma-K factor RskA
MTTDELHRLVAGYALDALDPEDERTFEDHLAGCERCRDELAAFRDSAAALAYDVDLPPLPETLGRRIISQARAERPAVVPIRRRLLFPAAAAASLAAAAALVLGIWAFSLSRSLDRQRSGAAVNARIISVLSEPDAKAYSLVGHSGALIVSAARQGVLVLNEIQPADRNKTYEAWIVDKKKARPAGLFTGSSGRTVVELKGPIPAGALVGVTLEPAGGSKEVTGPMLFQARVDSA